MQSLSTKKTCAWKEDNWDTFFADIREATQSQNAYFYGNILLETVEQDKRYDIIDGQQRVTTLILFFKALYTTKKEIHSIDDEKLKEMYLENKYGHKLEPVSYDQVFFNSLLKDRVAQLKPETPSQKRMLNCWLLIVMLISIA